MSSTRVDSLGEHSLLGLPRPDSPNAAWLVPREHRVTEETHELYRKGTLPS